MIDKPKQIGTNLLSILIKDNVFGLFYSRFYQIPSRFVAAVLLSMHSEILGMGRWWYLVIYNSELLVLLGSQTPWLFLCLVPLQSQIPTGKLWRQHRVWLPVPLMCDSSLQSRAVSSIYLPLCLFWEYTFHHSSTCFDLFSHWINAD